MDAIEDDEESSVFPVKGLLFFWDSTDRWVIGDEGIGANKSSRLGGGETIGSVGGRVNLEGFFS